MTNPDFKYDVAFSFLEQDEELALQINDLLRDRLKTFVYSHKQEKLAGKDGEETFNRVFGTETRIVFILYREGWGKTPWTRIEETAIRNRAFKEGYDFVLFAPLDKKTTPPKWLPKNRIWIDFERWGIEGAASVIEARVQEAGGRPREETAKEEAERLIREIATERKRKDFLNSEKGLESADNEIINLFSELESVVNNLSETKSDVKLMVKTNKVNRCEIIGDNFRLLLSWEAPYRNTLASSGLYLYLFHFKHPAALENPSRLKEIEFQFDLNKANKPVWRDSASRKVYLTQDLAKLSIKILLGQIRERM